MHVELRMKSSHTARVQNIYAARPRRDVLVRVTALRGRRWRAFAHEHRLASAHSRMAVCSLCGGDRTQPCSPTKDVVGACGWIPHAWRGECRPCSRRLSREVHCGKVWEIRLIRSVMPEMCYCRHLSKLVTCSGETAHLPPGSEPPPIERAPGVFANCTKLGSVILRTHDRMPAPMCLAWISLGRSQARIRTDNILVMT